MNAIIETMTELFLILLLGFGLNKAHMFDEDLNRKISGLIVNVTSPLLIISSVSSVQSSDQTLVFKLIGAGIIMYICFVIFGTLAIRLLPFPKDDRAVYECMCVFANTAFMGYPVLLSLFNEEAVFYASMIHLPFFLFVYTYGVICLNKNANEKYRFHPRQLLTPGFVLIFVAMGLYVFNIQLPTFLANTIESVGSITSPLSMMMIGSTLANYPLKESFTDWHSYMFAFIRLLIIPSLTFLACTLLNIDSYFANIAIITNAMPVASMVLMLATQYDANKEIVTRNIIVSTLLSIVTIPIIVGLYI